MGKKTCKISLTYNQWTFNVSVTKESFEKHTKIILLADNFTSHKNPMITVMYESWIQLCDSVHIKNTKYFFFKLILFYFFWVIKNINILYKNLFYEYRIKIIQKCKYDLMEKSKQKKNCFSFFKIKEIRKSTKLTLTSIQQRNLSEFQMN